MTVVQVSKRTIIRALRKEPLTTLRAGQWVGGADIGAHAVGATVCTVCAVGAVLRNAVLDSSQEARKIGEAASRLCHTQQRSRAPRRPEGDETTAQMFARVAPTRPMVALSDAFERMWSEEESAQTDWHRTRGNDRYWSNRLSRRRVAKIRETMVALVRKHFPATVTMDIGATVPAPGVTVVSTC